MPKTKAKPKRARSPNEDVPLDPLKKAWYCQRSGTRLPKDQVLDPGITTRCPAAECVGQPGWWAVEPPPAGGWDVWDGAIASVARRKAPAPRAKKRTRR
jgi:hypothetical protein